MKVDHVDCPEGYVTADDACHWVCSECVTAFEDRFRWTVVEASGA